MAIVDSVWTGASPPWELIEALMCREFRCFPSELAEEPADKILRVWSILNLFDSKVSEKVSSRRNRGSY